MTFDKQKWIKKIGVLIFVLTICFSSSRFRTALYRLVSQFFLRFFSPQQSLPAQSAPPSPSLPPSNSPSSDETTLSGVLEHVEKGSKVCLSGHCLISAVSQSVSIPSLLCSLSSSPSSSSSSSSPIPSSLPLSKIPLLSIDKGELEMMIRNYDVYIIFQCQSEEEEASFLKLVESIDLLSSGLESHKVLFCWTSMGRAHMVRHIAPTLHIDHNPSVLSTLLPFISILRLTPP